jgi:hypothetical protein
VYILCTLLISIVNPNNACAITFQQLKIKAQFENLGNPAYGAKTRTADELQLEHFEIPVTELVKYGFDLKSIPQEWTEPLLFKKEGRLTFRWLVNPHESKGEMGLVGYASQMQSWLRSKGLDAKTHRFFKGFFTASRSIYVATPNEKYIFSIKVSTMLMDENSLGDQKVYPNEESLGEGEFYKYLHERLDHDASNQFSYLDEPVHVGILELSDKFEEQLYRHWEPQKIKIISAGLSLRALKIADSDHRENQFFTLPGFSIEHDTFGLILAQANGHAEDPQKFVAEVYYALGKAVYELFLRTGVMPTSMHGQNFSLEVDDHLKWTGRIIFIDLADSNFHKGFMDYVGKDLSKMSWKGGPHLSEYTSLELYSDNFKSRRASWLTENATSYKSDPFRSGIYESFNEQVKIFGIKKFELPSPGRGDLLSTPVFRRLSTFNAAKSASEKEKDITAQSSERKSGGPVKCSQIFSGQH